MRTAIIIEEHFDFFADLDPFGYLDRAEFPDRVCIGSVAEGKDGGEDIPAGLMILHIMDEKVIVEWIYVRPEFRMHGIGSELMAYAFKAAQASGFERLYLSRDKVPGREDICLYEDDFLSEYSFENEENFSGEWTQVIKDLLDNPLLGEAATKHKKTKPLSSLDDQKLLEFKELIIEKGDHGFLYEPAYTDEFADRDVSRVIIDGGRITGGILVQYSGDDLYITGIYSEDRMDSIALCHGALMAAKEKYGEEKSVHILKYDDAYLELLTGLLGDECLKESICSASVDDYYEVLYSFEPFDEFYNIRSVLAKSE
ncbi:MAG: GNAT family N-acetyltransferase [Butyrivibrio sp.]|nr:GNAT family N-acetyltransferase [Butyrivibrio sp.]